MSDDEKGLILIGLLLLLAWRSESTSVNFPGGTVTKTCPDGSVIPYDQTCVGSAGLVPTSSPAPYSYGDVFNPFPPTGLIPSSNFLNPFAPGQVGDPLSGGGAWIENPPELLPL